MEVDILATLMFARRDSKSESQPWPRLDVDFLGGRLILDVSARPYVGSLRNANVHLNFSSIVLGEANSFPGGLMGPQLAAAEYRIGPHTHAADLAHVREGASLVELVDPPAGCIPALAGKRPRTLRLAFGANLAAGGALDGLEGIRPKRLEVHQIQPAAPAVLLPDSDHAIRLALGGALVAEGLTSFQITSEDLSLDPGLSVLAALQLSQRSAPLSLTLWAPVAAVGGRVRVYKYLGRNGTPLARCVQELTLERVSVERSSTRDTSSLQTTLSSTPDLQLLRFREADVYLDTVFDVLADFPVVRKVEFVGGSVRRMSNRFAGWVENNPLRRPQSDHGPIVHIIIFNRT